MAQGRQKVINLVDPAEAIPSVTDGQLKLERKKEAKAKRGEQTLAIKGKRERDRETKPPPKGVMGNLTRLKVDITMDLMFLCLELKPLEMVHGWFHSMSRGQARSALPHLKIKL